MKKIVFTGGGSAGHVVPNLAVIEQLKTRGDAEIFYIGGNGIEKRLAGDLPYSLISTPKLVRSLTPKNLLIPFALLSAVKNCRKILRSISPDLVFSKGGYVSLPVCLAAYREKIPVLIHESDLSAGLTTKLTAKRSRHVLCSFPETAQNFKNGRFTGSPLRKALFSADKSRAKKLFGVPSGKKTLLAFGGGSGSEAINRAVVANLPALTQGFHVLHVLGEKNAASAPKHAGYTPLSYVKDMGAAYACADLVLSRAGSNTLFELAALQIPAIIVPLLRGSRGDQAENAEYFRKKGLVYVLNEDDLPEKLAQTAIRTVSDDELKENLKSLPFPADGNEKIIAAIDEILYGDKN